jgi:uncharacterized surface protein with fasciclin (FAS1) repeats
LRNAYVARQHNYPSPSPPSPSAFFVPFLVSVSRTLPSSNKATIMKTFNFLGLAAAATAFIIPDLTTVATLDVWSVQEAKVQEAKEPHWRPFWSKKQDSHPFWNKVECPERFWEDLGERFKETAQSIDEKLHHAAGVASSIVDDAVEYAYDTAVYYGEKFEDAFAGQSWLDSADYDLDLVDKPPHHGPPHHGPPMRKPHHPPHHHAPNETIYEMIAKSKYTTKLAAAISEFPDLVDLLNGTKANYTVFAPTDRAFEKIPKHAPKPPKEFLKKLLTYHVSPDFYPAGRLLVTRTVPTALEAEFLSTKDHKVQQRLSTQIGFKGPTVNFYSRIVAADIFGTNGVIHGVDSILLPPPKAVNIIAALPAEFSTLELALTKTDLLPLFNDTSLHVGGTLFAPSNWAFQRLGPRINAFLFSQYGQKYLKALILYHVVDNITLYSDAIYKADAADGPHRGPRKGFFHIDLPTGLEGKSLSVDIARYGRFITIKINGFTRVAVSDGIAADGVIHVIPNVLIPPKTPGGPGVADDDMDLDEFKARLAPFVGDESDEEFNLEL